MTEPIKIVTIWIGLAVAVSMLINQLLDIRAKLANKNAMVAKLSTSGVGRHWQLWLVAALGMAGMFSIALVLLAPSSVLGCVLGGVLTACAIAGILVLEVSRLLSDKVLALLRQHIEAGIAGQSRIVGVLEAMTRTPQRSTDKPD